MCLSQTPRPWCAFRSARPRADFKRESCKAMTDYSKGTIVLQALDDSPSDQSPLARSTVYHDGSCPLCTAEIEYYATRSDGNRLDFVDVSDPKAELGPGLAQKNAMSRFHVRLPDGSIASGADAFVSVWDALPAWNRGTRIASLPGAKAVLRIGYRLFLPMRPALSALFGRLTRSADRKNHSGP